MTPTTELIEQPAAAVQVIPPPTNTTPAQLLAIAVQRGADIAQLERLMALQERFEANEARKAFSEAFAAFKSSAVTVLRTKEIKDGPLKGKKHAELGEIVKTVSPALSNHGLSLSWKITKDEPGWLEVTCTIRHVAGHSESVSMGGAPDTGPGRNAIQARGSAKSYLERYTATAILGLAAADEDDDGNGGPKQKTVDQQAKASESEALRDAGQNAAMQGTDALNKWWGALNAKQRGLMNSDFGSMRKAARAADLEGK